MKIYIVTSGDYSDYSIEAVFTDKELAWKYACMDRDRRIEEYKADEKVIKGNICSYIQITYDFDKNKLTEVAVSKKTSADIVERGLYPCRFTFWIPNTMQLYYSSMRSNCRSRKLLKIAQDRFAQYLEKNQISREECIQKSKADSDKYRNDNDYNYRYPFYSTSLVTVDPVDLKLTEYVQSYYLSNGCSPTTEQLMMKRAEIIEEKNDA